MNRRGLFKLLGVALVLPFLPKPKKYIGRRVVVDRVKLEPFTDFKPYKWRGDTNTYTYNESELYTVHYDSVRFKGKNLAFRRYLDDKRATMTVEIANGMDDRLWQPSA